MCGIAGVLFKHQGEHEIGKTLIDMLDGCQHRGPDSTGFALYGETRDLLQLRFIVPTEASARQAAAAITEHASAAPGLFEANETDPKSEALPAIWEDFASFEAAASALVTAAQAADLTTPEGLAPAVAGNHQIDDFYR